MDIDIRTFSIVMGFNNVLQVILLFFLFLMNKTYRGMGWWAGGLPGW
ncbi:MAG: hypothetical protein NTX88_05890 [Candidatus Atribacteria bacterium]|nr:hypothetical protein [Candidatus Atribacteria bacterium]